MKKMARKIVIVLTLMLLIPTCIGCQTVQGLGRDITSVGEAVEDAVD